MTDLDPEKCPTCGKPPCAGCNRAGLIIDLDHPGVEDRATPCPHIKVVKLKQYLGPEMSRVKHVKSEELSKLADQNLLIRAPSWEALLPHLKWVLGSRAGRFRYSIVTDERILMVYVGNESFKSKLPEDREDGYINSLDDLMKYADLTIVRIGHIWHRNKAAEGALLEALSIRRAANKPTWIVDDDPYRRIETCVIWGQDLSRYLETYQFDEYVLDTPAGQEPVLSTMPSLTTQSDEDTVTDMLGRPQPRPAKASRPPAMPREPQFELPHTATPHMLDVESIMGKPKKKKWQ